MSASTRSMKLAGALMIASISATSLVAPRPAHAIVAAATGGTAIPALIVLGVGGGIVPLSLAGIRHDCGKTSGSLCNWSIAGLLVAAPLAILTGIVLLDDTGAPTTQFRKITPAFAAQHALNARQAASFNRQLPRVNAVSQSIAREIAKQKPETAEGALRIAHEGWANAMTRGVISDDTYAALGKVSENFARRLDQQTK